MKKAFRIMLCLVITLSLPGCWSRREPKNLAIVVSAVYDKLENGSYQVTIEVINPSGSGSGPGGSSSSKSPTITAISEGLSVPEAIRNVSDSLEKSLFGGINKVRLFTDSFARADVVAATDFYLRDHLTDENPLMVVMKNGGADRLYSCVVGLSDTVGDYINELSMTQSDANSKAVFIDTHDFVKAYYDDGKQPVLGAVEFVECGAKPSMNTNTGSEASQVSGEKQYRIVYEGLAAFKDGKLVGYMDGTETRAYNFITNNTRAAILSVPSGDSFSVALVHGSTAEISAAVKDGRAEIEVALKLSLSLVQEGGDIDISMIEPLKAVDSAYNELMEKELTAAIQKAQTEFQSDIFGFGTVLHRQHPETWREIKGNWDDYFAGASLRVTVESSIDRSGEIKKPFKQVY